MVFREMYIKKIMAYVDTPFIKILTGIRRCGKSTILRMIADEIKKKGVPEKRILFYNFDSMEHDEIKTARSLYDSIKKQLSKRAKTYLFFDEIQEVESWEKSINSFMTDFNVDIYITGSNSRMLSSEIATYLTGRYISFPVFTLSFNEYILFRKKYSKLGDRYLEFARYLRLGAFPAVHLQEYTNEETYTIIKDIYNSTIFTDIVKRNQIRKIELLERIVKFVFENIGRTFSASSISKFLKNEKRTIDNETVYNYLSKLEAAFIIHRCPRFDIQGKEMLKTQEKFYLADSALRYSILGYNSDSISAMLENLVYLELLRRGWEVSVGKLKDTEIDFVATKQENKIYIQVAERIEKPETQKREYERLLAISDNYPKYVLLASELAGGNFKGIKTMHIADFLMEKKW